MMERLVIVADLGTRNGTMTSPSRYTGVTMSPTKGSASQGMNGLGHTVGSPVRSPVGVITPPGGSPGALTTDRRDSYFAQMLERNCSVGKGRRVRGENGKVLDMDAYASLWTGASSGAAGAKSLFSSASREARLRGKPQCAI